MTLYIVLRRDDEEGKDIGDMLKWTVVGRSEARSADAAITDIVANVMLSEDAAGMYVAVPERSWKPQQVIAFATTTIKLEQPT